MRQLFLKKLNKGKDNSNIIAKITIKSKKRKILKYYNNIAPLPISNTDKSPPHIFF